MKIVTKHKFIVYFILILVLFSLLNIKILAQTLYEYEDSLITLNGNGDLVAVTGRSIEDSTSYTGYRDMVDVYNTQTGEIILEYDGSAFQITSITLNSDGSQFAYTTNAGQLAIVDVTTGDTFDTLAVGGGMDVGSPSWSNMGQLFGFFSGRVIALYNSPSFQSYGGIININSTNGVSGYDWHPDDTQIAVSMRNPNSGEAELLIWNIVDEENLLLEQTIVTSVLSQLDWHPNGQLIATNQRGGIKIIDITSNNETFLETPDPDDAIRTIAWNSDGSKIVAGGNQAVYVWDNVTQSIIDIIQTEDRVRAVFWSPDGQFIYHTGGPAGIYRNGIPLQDAIEQSQNICDETHCE